MFSYWLTLLAGCSRGGRSADKDSAERGRVARSRRHLELLHRLQVMEGRQPDSVELRQRHHILYTMYVTASGIRGQSVAGFSDRLQHTSARFMATRHQWSLQVQRYNGTSSGDAYRARLAQFPCLLIRLMLLLRYFS